ncbi:baseplate J/gp47 family protein [Endozoicomonas acroporae]|uniref:baseplate J/gp47 family protein n=1 Tax=Endozoicomonas acroporae TaxID=1701104 RepID=UPI0013D2A83A|nr:baseplate J/gp47 family protein [Endozoicomonas acroporae]
MSRQRPTLRELVAQMQADLATRHNIPVEQVRHSNVGMDAVTFAGAIHGLEGYLDYIGLQSFEDTATGAFLRRRGAIRGVLINLATTATGSRRFLADDGTTRPSGTLMQRDDGTQFITTASATASSGELSVAVQCLQAGSVGNTTANQSLTLVSPIDGINPVSPDGLVSGGDDEEQEEAYRQRLLTFIRMPPAGGASHDYKRWVKETPGVPVDKVWNPDLWMGAGTVTLFFTVDRENSLPTADDIQRVTEHIDSQRQTGMKERYVLAPTAEPVQHIISGLTPDTPEVRQAIEHELRGLYLREAELADGTGSGTILLSHIREAISLAAGEQDYTLLAPAGNIEPAKGKLAIFGGITWQ